VHSQLHLGFSILVVQHQNTTSITQYTNTNNNTNLNNIFLIDITSNNFSYDAITQEAFYVEYF